MDYKDYYAILGTEKSATQDEIKKAYRQLAKTWHPDKNPGSKVAETRFKEISEAYEVLSDVEKKKHYDNLGKDWNKYQQYNNPKEYYKQTRPNDKAPDFDIDDLFKSDGKNDGKGGFSDFFSNIFGDSNKKKPAKGQDYETEMEITLDDAYKGVTKIMTVLSQKLRIQLKPGVPHEQSLRLKGKGGEGANGVPAGDLFVKVKILPHPLFKREGNDLHCELPVDLYTAVLGGKVFIATLDGGTNFILPAGTENGKTLRLKSKGMPDYNNPTNIGDLFVKLNVQIPKDLSSQEIELFTKLAEIRKK